MNEVALSAGVTWRPLSREDAGAMSELQQACFAVDGGYRLTASEMRDEFDAYGDHSETDSIGGFDAASHGIASALVTMAMRTFGEDGIGYACLGVDSESQPGPTGSMSVSASCQSNAGRPSGSHCLAEDGGSRRRICVGRASIRHGMSKPER